MMKLAKVMSYLKKIKKELNYVSNPLSSAAFFHREPSNFAISKSTDIDCALVAL